MVDTLWAKHRQAVKASTLNPLATGLSANFDFTPFVTFGSGFYAYSG